MAFNGIIVLFDFDLRSEVFTMSLLEVRDVCKEFSDEFSLRDISFEIDAKGVYGFLGKSESGKSALAFVLAGAVEIDSGSIAYKGSELYSTQKQTAMIKRKIGFVPQKCVFDSDMTAFEVLDFTGRAKGVEPDKRYRQIKEALEITGLVDKKDFLVKSLGLSEKKRLAIANSLLASPDVIIMDEPLRYLDPSQADEIRSLIAMLEKKKVILIFSSHAGDIQSICSHTAILVGGRIVLWDSVESILSKLRENGMDGLAATLNAFDADEVEDEDEDEEEDGEDDE